MLENNQQTIVEKNKSVVEIDLKKGEKRKLTLFGFKGKVALSIIILVYVNIALLVGMIYGLASDETLTFGVLLMVMIAINIIFPIKLSKVIRNHKKRYILKSESLDDLVEFLDCPNYEEKIRIDNKKITFKHEDDDVDYYADDMEEDEEQSTKFVHSYDDIDFEEMCNDIVKFAEKKGLSTDVNSVRLFLSAINSSHLVEVDSENLEISKKFVDVLSEYLGKSAFYSKEHPSWEKPEDTLWKRQSNVNVETKVLKSLLSANKNKGNFTFLGLVDVVYSKFENYFSQMLNFVNHPNRKILVEVSPKYDNGVDPVGRLTIPKNIWFIVFPKTDVENKISEKIVKNLVKIEITGSIIDESEEVIEHDAISIEQFNYSVNKAADEADINEDLWKKYDEFILESKKYVPFDINDKYFYGIENFTLMYVIAGGEESSALDYVVNCKVLPMILNLKELEISEIGIFIDLLENIFDTEGFTASIKTLNKLKEN